MIMNNLNTPKEALDIEVVKPEIFYTFKIKTRSKNLFKRQRLFRQEYEVQTFYTAALAALLLAACVFLTIKYN